MMKRLILSFFLLLSLSLQAQTEKRDSLMNDNIEADSLTSVRPSAFKRAIKKFMNFSDFDTLYISPNRYNYALMVTHFSNFVAYSITSELPLISATSNTTRSVVTCPNLKSSVSPPIHITKSDCTLAGGGFSWAGLLMWTIFTGKPIERIKVRSST